MPKTLVMYLEDDPNQRNEANASLLRSGMAKTIELALFDNFLALEKEMRKRSPDILLLDNDLSSVLENGLTRGVDLIPKYRKLFPKAIIAQRTTFMSEADKKRSIDAGAIEIFSKHDDISDIVKYCLILMER